MKYNVIHIIVLIFILILSWSTGESQPNSVSNIDTSDLSYAFISAIKSVSGTKPEDEFFDINIKYDYKSWLISFAQIDVALSNVKTDSVKGDQKKLSEAGFSLNCPFLMSDDSSRKIIFGGNVKVFNEVSLLGFQLGGYETSKSLLATSYLFFSYLWRAQPIDSALNKNQDIPDSYHNFYAEFALHSDKIDFLKWIRIKGGVLMPIEDGKIAGLRSRIVIEVPIGGVTKF